MLLQGTEETNVDDKGRTAFPARFRDAVVRIQKAAGQSDELPARLVVVPWFTDGCLRAFPQPTWERKLEAFQHRLAPERTFERDEESSWLVRMLIGDSREIEPDSHGRIVLPADLRRAARLSKVVLWKGLLDCIEVWDPVVYQEATARHAALVRRTLSAYASDPLPPVGSAPAILSSDAGVTP